MTSADVAPDAADPSIDPEQKQIGQLNALLETSEARGDAAQQAADRLRAEKESLSDALDRSTRLLNNLRTDYDCLRAEADQKDGHDSAALSETVRLRSHVVEIERELQRVSSRAEESSRLYVEEKKRCEALERICMSLRSRVAIAEDKAQDEKTVQEALIAREAAEAQLVEAKVEVERWRARSSAADITRERAEAAERSERIQRDKVAALERELESRESLLKQGMHERRKLKEYMQSYEKELEDKEMRLARLRGFIKEHRFGDSGKPWSRHAGDAPDDSLGSEEDTDVVTSTSLTVEKDVGNESYGLPRNWDREPSARESGVTPVPTHNPDSAINYAEASPLLREVEEAHAQLQAVFREPGAEKGGAVDTDLKERVRRLEASFDRLAHSRNISPE